MIYRILILLLFFIQFVYLANGQNDTIGEIDKIEVSTKYRPQVSEARKIVIKPNIEKRQFTSPNLSYQTPPSFKYLPRHTFLPTKPTSLKGELKDYLYNNYIRAGFGNYLSPLVELYLHNTYNQDYGYGAYLKHHSMQGSNGELERADMAENQINIHGKKFGKRNVLSGFLDFKRNGYNLYGYDYENDSLDFKRDDVHDAINLLSAEGKFENKYRNFNNELGLDFQLLSTNQKAERDFGIWGSTKFERKRFFIKLPAAIRWNSIGIDSANDPWNTFLFETKPRVKFGLKKKTLDLEVGFNLAITYQTFFNPMAKINYKIVEDNKLNAFVKIDGGFVRTGFLDLLYQNPFMVEENIRKDRFNPFNISGGLIGSLNQKLDYDFNLGYYLTNNMPLFVADSNVFNSFKIVFDDVSYFNLHLALDYRPSRAFRWRFIYDFYDYNTNEHNEAWQLPSSELETNIFIKPISKLELNAGLVYFGKRAYLNLNDPSTEDELDQIVDLNVGAKYIFKKNIHFFVNANNLLNKNYQFYGNYPTFGLNVLGGIGISL